MQKAIIDEGQYASVKMLEDVGHLVRPFAFHFLKLTFLQVVQEAPDLLGKAIYDALVMNARLRSRL